MLAPIPGKDQRCKRDLQTDRDDGCDQSSSDAGKQNAWLEFAPEISEVHVCLYLIWIF
jgi:hypothetical protein